MRVPPLPMIELNRSGITVVTYVFHAGFDVLGNQVCAKTGVMLHATKSTYSMGCSRHLFMIDSPRYSLFDFSIRAYAAWNHVLRMNARACADRAARLMPGTTL